MTRTGPIFRSSDYPGFFIRLGIDILDIAFILVACFAAFLLAASFIGDGVWLGRAVFCLILVPFLYLGPLKATRIPTLGYLLFRVKLVDIEGKRPNLWQASGRGLALCIGPLNILLDLFWLYNSAPRRALRDVFSGTFLIRKDAQVEGTGTIVRKTLYVMGYHARIEELSRIEGAS